MPRVIYISAADSVVTASPATIENDGTARSYSTLTVVDSRGNPVQGLAAAQCVLAVTGTGNTVTQPTGVTDINGQITGSFVSTGAATKTASWTVCSLAVTDTASIVVSAASGTVATVTDISRDVSNTDGGDLVTFTITSPVDLPSVTFGGTSATEITLVNSTTLTCRVPAKTAGYVAVVVGGQTFTNPRASAIGGDFEYLPVATTTFVDADFEGGTIPASLSTELHAGSTVAASTEEVYSGTYAVKCFVPGPASGGKTAYLRNTTNIDIASEANGVYVRFYVYYPAATLSNLGDQMKTHLFRRQAGNGQPGWTMTGIGPAFPNSAGGDYTSFVDNGILTITGGQSTVLAADTWREFVYWQFWNAGTTQGRIRLWIDGKCQFDRSDAALGGTATDYRVQIGIPWVQNPVGDSVGYVDEIFIGNGLPNPVEV